MPEITAENAEEITPVLRALSTSDLQMLVYLNAKERMVGEWQELIRKTDERFLLRGVHLLEGSQVGMLEWEFVDREPESFFLRTG